VRKAFLGALAPRRPWVVSSCP